MGATVFSSVRSPLTGNGKETSLRMTRGKFFSRTLEPRCVLTILSGFSHRARLTRAIRTKDEKKIKAGCQSDDGRLY
ncbi:hypothetical protein PUN28_018668 [Cardiocondyla obscurior]|uniref:Uncharacterized protein n=1 Tax=Cardiocondyla obscurior TaxID=286306 RepID=A0AAW2EEZ7_9HYME